MNRPQPGAPMGVLPDEPAGPVQLDQATLLAPLGGQAHSQDVAVGGLGHRVAHVPLIRGSDAPLPLLDPVGPNLDHQHVGEAFPAVDRLDQVADRHEATVRGLETLVHVLLVVRPESAPPLDFRDTGCHPRRGLFAPGVLPVPHSNGGGLPGRAEDVRIPRHDRPSVDPGQLDRGDRRPGFPIGRVVVEGQQGRRPLQALRLEETCVARPGPPLVTVEEEGASALVHVYPVAVQERPGWRARASDSDLIGGFGAPAAGVPVGEEVVVVVPSGEEGGLDPLLVSLLQVNALLRYAGTLGKVVLVRVRGLPDRGPEG